MSGAGGIPVVHGREEVNRVVMPDERCPLLHCGWERVDEPDDTRESIAVAIRGHLDECHVGWTTAELQAAVLVRQLPTVFRAGVVELFGPMSAPPWDRRNPNPPDPDDLTLILTQPLPGPFGGFCDHDVVLSESKEGYLLALCQRCPARAVYAPGMAPVGPPYLGPYLLSAPSAPSAPSATPTPKESPAR